MEFAHRTTLETNQETAKALCQIPSSILSSEEKRKGKIQNQNRKKPLEESDKSEKK